MNTISFNERPIALGLVADLKNELLTTNSSSSKKVIVSDFLNSLETVSEQEREDVKYYIEAIFNSHIKFGLTSALFNSVEHNNTSANISDKDVIDVLKDGLSKHISAADFKKKLVNIYANLPEDCADILSSILDKDFGCGVSTSMYRSMFSSDETLGVSLANSYKDHKNKVDFEHQDWYMSRKLDGCRLNIVKTSDVVKTLSRQQVEFTTLDVLKEKIAQIPGEFLLDGEVITSSGLENDDFQGIIKQIKKKDYTIPDPVMLVFDILTIDEAYGRTVSPKFSERYEKLQRFFDVNKTVLGSSFILVEQTKCNSDEEMTAFFDDAMSRNWEGIMLRKDVPWEGKRTSNLLKVKEFSDAEFIITGYELGDFTYKNTILHNVLTSIKIDYNGYPVSVGSGFSLEQRKQYALDPEALIGCVAKVKYFEATDNQKGGKSLRFPTILNIYDKSGRFD